VLDGKISPALPLDAFGIVLTADGAVDDVKTKEVRERRREAG
jgi:hypothetical protein